MAKKNESEGKAKRGEGKIVRHEEGGKVGGRCSDKVGDEMINSTAPWMERKRYLAINCVEFGGTELAFVLTCCWTAAAAAVLHLPKDEDLILYFGLFFCDKLINLSFLLVVVSTQFT